MISTFCGTFLVQPSSRSQDSNYWYFSLQCWTTYAFCLLLGLAGCGSAYHLQESTSNVSLPTDNTCLVDTVHTGYYRLYPLDIQGCSNEDVDGYLYVELLVTNRSAPDVDFIADLFGLVVDTKEQIPALNVSKNSSQPGTTFSTRDDNDPDYFNRTVLTLPLRDYDQEVPWYGRVSAWTEDVTFVLRAWCTGSKDCAEKCEEMSTRCVGRGSCKCVITPNHSDCDTDVRQLQTDYSVEQAADVVRLVSLEQIVAPGEWNYFSFEAQSPNDRILVELRCEQGDTALFLKPGNANTSLTVPSESDFDHYSDVDGFRNRLSKHYRYISGGESFVIGVLNSNACVKETAAYHLAVTVLPKGTAQTLCPFNCSFPQGSCVRDTQCKCEDGFAGAYCDASLESEELFKPFGNTLQPGEIIYYELSLEKVVGTKPLSISFSSHGGQAILLVGEQGAFPTLSTNTLKMLEAPPSADNVSFLCTLGNVASSNESIILAVFNADDFVQEESVFRIHAYLREAENAKKALSPALVLLVGFLSSAFALLTMAMVKFLLHRWDGGGVVQTFEHNILEDVEDVALVQRGLGRDVVESYPLITYQEELKLKETQCSICLSEYNISDNLRVIPPCTHTFHVGCVDKWLQDHATCPICRAVLHSSPVHGSSASRDAES